MTLHHPSLKDMMNDVVAAGTCCECGSCVLVCPHNVIEYIGGKPKQTAKASAPFDYCGVSEGIGCDVCAQACPRLWPREIHLRDAVFRDRRPWEDIFGAYRHIFAARTKDAGIMERAQDGGIVTALLSWALEAGEIDGAVVAAVGEDDPPCAPSPKVVTTQEGIRASAGSWYTYCPNNLALKEAAERDLKKVAFVGVPCQITPIRKMELIDPSFLLSPKKRPQHIEKQRGFLRGFAGRVALQIGLFCTEVFTFGLMTEKIEKGLGIPLADVAKFNVKGEVLVHKKDGELVTFPLEEAMRDYQRPECRHCADFSAELADIACGGVGTRGWTIVMIRTERGERAWRAFEAAGRAETMPIRENRRAWNILQILARRQRGRVPAVGGKSGTGPGLPQYSPKEGADHALARMAGSGKSAAEIEAGLAAAYGGEDRPVRVTGYMAGQPIPGDPGEPPPGEKRKLPPPPSPEQGGAPPGWRPPEIPPGQEGAG
ncbi:MAG: Coenzyme F420 hydrogenase/dehydrogenase, beta subunit C-terminal domain [Candidatus Tectomicrobia bacterium]|uniref:Coenzyme F420 hydrogenase/dehydrogenase, beta subunit C-terminal domain n=1 Tax=Tectimicrobiota bacterium TaxID=2528274 RepID=A0A932I0U4_UNCTE|nr:Coenzyme F420 hydrogenase/dehydrogenase, beta subunit C-terminal domain [Candidatus Tectomicrobia bacterium]